MGAGKSTIGRHLARRLNRPFWDSDQEIERSTGVNIPTIFDYEGETGFRKRECAIVEKLCHKTEIVMATGGGAVLNAHIRRLLKSHGTVIYLRTSIETQLERTARDRNRPLLQTENPRERLQTLKKQRDPLYLEVANLVLDTDRHSIAVIEQRIINWFEK